jgi:hypothetical protein
MAASAIAALIAHVPDGSSNVDGLTAAPDSWHSLRAVADYLSLRSAEKRLDARTEPQKREAMLESVGDRMRTKLRGQTVYETSENCPFSLPLRFSLNLF